MAGTAERRARLRRDGAELWLDPEEVVWFAPETGRHPMYLAALSRAVAAVVPDRPLLAGAGGAAVAFPQPAFPARPQPRSGRTGWSARRKRRFATRFVPTAMVVLSAAVSLPWLVHRSAHSSVDQPAAAPPKLIRTPGVAWPVSPPTARVESPSVVAPARQKARAGTPGRAYPEVRWRESNAIGLPHDGRLVDGVQLPVEGPDWVTWDPERHRAPNRASRLYGTDELVRVVLSVVVEYRTAHPDAPRVVIGDLSRRGGGPISEHVSHENGLDVDVYFPRLDRRLAAPTSVEKIDMRLAQDLVDRFVEAGAKLVLVGHGTRLRGPAGVVVPYTKHDNHMHIRLAQPKTNQAH